jgi:hypothetical protein
MQEAQQQEEEYGEDMQEEVDEEEEYERRKKEMKKQQKQQKPQPKKKAPQPSLIDQGNQNGAGEDGDLMPYKKEKKTFKQKMASKKIIFSY